MHSYRSLVMPKRIANIIGPLGLLALLLLVPSRAPAEPAGPDASVLTVEDMAGTAREEVNKMEEMLISSFKLLEQSISTSDVASTAIRNEAITAMKGLVKLSEENLIMLQQKKAEGDRDAVEHEYVKISIAAAKVAELYAQVRTASGIDVDLEDTRVERTMDIESSLPMDMGSVSSADISSSLDVLPDPPSHASPFI
jgi:hypothetical protein